MAAETAVLRFPDQVQDTTASRIVLPALVFAAAASQLGFVVANPILLDIAGSFHLPLGVVAQGRTLQNAGGAAAALAATVVADRVPRKLQLLVGLTVMTGTGIALALIPAFPVWLLIQVISGAASGLVALACSAAIGDYVAEPHRGAAMGYTAAGMGLAWLVGLPVVGFVAAAWGWRFAYALLGGGSALASWIVVAVALRTLECRRPSHQHLLAGWRVLLAHCAARGLLVGDALTGAAWAGFLIYLGPFFGTVYHMQSSGVGTMLALAAVIGTAGTLCAAPLAARVGRHRLLVAASILAAAAIATPLNAKWTPILSLLTLTPYIFLNCLRFPSSGAIALSLLPEMRGTMMAARSFTIALAGMVGSLLGAILLAFGGFGTIGAGCALLTIAGAYAYAKALPHRLPYATLRASTAATETS